MRDLLDKRPSSAMNMALPGLPPNHPVQRPIPLGDTDIPEAYLRSIPGLFRALDGASVPQHCMPLTVLLRGLVERFDMRETKAHEWKRRATLESIDEEWRAHVEELKRQHSFQLRSLRLELEYQREGRVDAQNDEARRDGRRDTPDQEDDRPPLTELPPKDQPQGGPKA